MASIIFAHSIIPHDHHSDIADEISHEHKENKQGKHSRHCHFFNDIVINKKNINNRTIKLIQKDLSYNIAEFQSVDNRKNFFCISKTNTNISIKSKNLINTKPTRGSPFVC